MTESGLVVVDKPGGLTSHDVVARIRRIAGTRKVGHAGTLDPMATGVLVIGVNRATRLLGHLMLSDKSYEATIRLGVSTDTDDAEGEVTGRTSAAPVSDDDVRRALAAFTGEIEQVPATVSAVKVGGKRAYRLAREGRAVELPARRVTIHALDVTGTRRDGEALDVDVSVTCSSGTYVRAIARDLGRALGVGGHLTALRRTAVGPFGLDDAPLSLEQMAERGQLNWTGMETVGVRLFTHLRVDADVAREISFGRPLALTLPAQEGPVAMIGPSGELLALYEQRGPTAVPLAVLC